MMAGVYFIDRRTREEVQRDHEKWVAQHYLEEGKRYTFTIEKRRRDFYNPFKGHIYYPYIKQADCPWMSVTMGPNFATHWQATRWAKDYLKRGGPPDGFFDPPAPDPNIVTFGKAE